MALKAREFERIVRKLKLVTRNTGDRQAWFVYDGRQILRTKRSHQKGDLPFASKIRTQLKLTEDQFRDLIRCPLTYDGYVNILRDKGILPPETPE